MHEPVPPVRPVHQDAAPSSGKSSRWRWRWPKPRERTPSDLQLPRGFTPVDDTDEDISYIHLGEPDR